MAFVVTPLCLLLFGIVVYGYLMSFRQNMTQAAAEGARAGAVAPADAPVATPLTHTIAIARATDATNKALSSFGNYSCGGGGMTCNITAGSCPTPSTAQCVFVTVTYDYSGHPLMPDIPLVSAAIPGTFTSSSTAEINS
jgi:Flp pilus assembly protein TadG